jgi:hypothetical protein
LLSGVFGLGALQAKAEHYYIQDQILVCGTQRLDPNFSDGQHFCRDRCVGTSTVLGLFNESSTCVLGVVTAEKRFQTLGLTGQAVINCANGDKICYRYQGRITMSGSAGIRNLAAQVTKCTVTVTGGTGVFRNASGGGEMTCVTTTEGQFSTRLDLTICLPGEK